MVCYILVPPTTRILYNGIINSLHLDFLQSQYMLVEVHVKFSFHERILSFFVAISFLQKNNQSCHE
jgi:hypothetical protein